MRRRHLRLPVLRFVICAGVMCLLVASVGLCAPVAAWPWLHVDDTGRVVDDQANPVCLRGTNLGNWLLIEPWMLGIDDKRLPDQYSLEKTLGDRFGADELNRLMDLYRQNWITDKDFAVIRSFGFNLVRFPINCELLETADRPFELKPEAWRWIDLAIARAEAQGLYVILDLHGAPGGQTPDNVCGRGGRNELWKSEPCRKRTLWLWERIAERYRDRPSVAAYDLLNEPWGGTQDQLRSLVGSLYEAVRRVDDRHIIILPGWRDSIDFYGDPHSLGWRNVMFTMHFYPGLFDGKRAIVDTHARFFKQDLPEWKTRMGGLNTPLYVGEFQVAFRSAGGAEMMRRYFDAYAANGWPATMWSYKVLTQKGGIGKGTWGMVTNKSPMSIPDVFSAPVEAIEQWFRSFSTIDMQTDDELMRWMTTDAVPGPLPEPLVPPEPRRHAPLADALPEGWTATDIGGARPGGQRVTADSFEIYGGGRDIWGDRDQFRFTWQKIKGSFVFEARIVSLEPVHLGAKAGLMARTSLRPDAASALVNVFPEGSVEMIARTTSGGASTLCGEEIGRPFPLTLRLARTGDTLTSSYALDNGDWSVLGSTTVPSAETLFVGLATLSHDNAQLVQAVYEHVALTGQREPVTADDTVVPSEAPFDDPLPDGWTASDIAGALAGGQRVVSPSIFEIYGGGDDIWNDEDQFRFVWQKLDRDFVLTATVADIQESHQYAKAGVMIRSGLGPDAAQAMAVLFPSGGLEVACREQDGGLLAGKGGGQVSVGTTVLRLHRAGRVVRFSYRCGDGPWIDKAEFDLPAFEKQVYAGIAVLSHDNSRLTRAVVKDIAVTRDTAGK